MDSVTDFIVSDFDPAGRAWRNKYTPFLHVWRGEEQQSFSDFIS